MRFLTRLVGALFALGVNGAVAGTLFVLALFWWHGRDLPSTRTLSEYQPATLSRVYSSDGALLAEFARERRFYTPIDEVPALLKHAVISAEDKHFYEHSGVDGLGLLKAMVDNLNRYAQGRSLRGASTITQQVVKNFLLSGERAVSRKVREALLARRLETALTKDQILELYLNEIFLGARAYGVTSAALRYFGKKLEDLTAEEAAYLAALPKAPSDYDPVKQYDRAVERRNYVLNEMRENGYLTLEAYEQAIATPLRTLMNQRADAAAAQAAGEAAPAEAEVFGRAAPELDYFAEEVRRTLIARFGEEDVFAGGLTVRATIDPRLQDIARSVLQARLDAYGRERGYGGPVARLEGVDLADAAATRAALAAVEAPRDILTWRLAVVREVGQKTAEVLIEGVDTAEPIRLAFADVREWARRRTGYDADGFPQFGPDPAGPAEVWAPGDVIYVAPTDTQDAAAGWSMRQIPDVNGALVAMDPRTGRVLAVQGGFSFEASVFNRATQAKRQPGSAFKPFVYAAALENGYAPNSIVLDAPIVMPQVSGEDWRPKNYSGRFYGPTPLRVGIEKSQNLMTVRIAMDVGLDKVADYAKRFGVYEDMPPLLSFALGAGETTLLQMTASYAMFVNGGKLIEPTVIDRVQDRHGRTVFRHDDRICPECAAATYTGQAEPYVPDEGAQVLDAVTAAQVVSMLEGVTLRGTASGVGKALPFAVAGKTGTTNDARDAWFVGFSSDLAVGCYIGFDTPRTLGRKQSGGSLCAPVFEAFMAAAYDGREPPAPFRRPAGATLVKVDRQSGCAVPPDFGGAQYIWEIFRAGVEPLEGECPPGGFDNAAFTLDDTPATEAPLDAPATPAAATAAVGGASPQQGESAAPRPRPVQSTVGAGTGGIY